MLIFNLHCQLVFRISGNTNMLHIPNVKFSLYLKKAGLASRNIVHLQKNPFCVVLVSASIFFILYLKSPAGSENKAANREYF